MESKNLATYFTHPMLKNISYEIDLLTSALKEKIRRIISELVPPIEVDIEDVKAEIWNDIASLYYKFDVNSHKRGFREVMREISEKIRNDNWDAIYQKIYRLEHKKGRSGIP